MTDQFAEFRASVVAAVQQELTRFSAQVSSEFRHLRGELAAERTAREVAESQLAALTGSTERRIAEVTADATRRHDEVMDRVGRITDEANAGMNAAVEAAARPVFQALTDHQVNVEERVAKLGQSVQRFDQQAAQVVQHVNALSAATEARIDANARQASQDLDTRLATVVSRIDEVSAQAARQQAEITNMVGNRVDSAEARLNERIQSAEARLGDDIGQRVADIDAYVGRISAGLDESVATLSDRLTSVDSRFGDVGHALAAINQRFEKLDVDSIDEMKDRVMGLAGEVELVRIETDRFEKSTSTELDKLTNRLVDVETQVQEQHMDVETAVQLERLEEVERAIIALDPSQFVRRDELNGGPVALPSDLLSTPEPFQPSVTLDY